MTDNELSDDMEQPGRRPIAKSVILDAMVSQIQGVNQLSSCDVPGFAQASIEFEGRRYLLKLMEI